MILPQMNKKQVVATLETNVKTMSGNNKFNTTANVITSAEKFKAFPGTWCFDNRFNFIVNGCLASLVSEDSIRPVVKMELLQAEAAAVMTTKLMISAAA